MMDRENMQGAVHRYVPTVERTTNLRTRWLWLPYGDQALAMTRVELDQIGGVPDQPMMEDFELVCRVRRKALLTGGRIAVIPAPAKCNPRRWLANGVYRTTCLLYTSDAADEEDSVDLGGRRIIKKKKKEYIVECVRKSKLTKVTCETNGDAPHTLSRE
eukprot:TRINITY_DN8837_c0_g1_i6.p1 TRINITY_DN8837_c0_g1~~TRINITY_DN8837_c0_g1_i6.p1  ORF type:complete len:159 (-),score=20.19 TRINITY_DN8837_c0_g1_i6:16-492(-)